MKIKAETLALIAKDVEGKDWIELISGQHGVAWSVVEDAPEVEKKQPEAAAQGEADFIDDIPFDRLRGLI